jgi:hypothetical protein
MPLHSPFMATTSASTHLSLSAHMPLHAPFMATTSASTHLSLSAGGLTLMADEVELLLFQLNNLRKGKLAPMSTLSAIPLLLEYLKYMALKLSHPKSVVQPSPMVDEVWHAHILSTRCYSSFCARSCGAFIHHEPVAGTIAGYAATLIRYKQRYRESLGFEKQGS